MVFATCIRAKWVKEKDFGALSLNDGLQTFVAWIVTVNKAQPGAGKTQFANLNLCKDEMLTVTVCRAQPSAASSKKLAHLFWRIAQARILKQVEVCEKLASSLMKQTEELTEGLVSIQQWIRGGTPEGQPMKWQQKTLMQQGALELLQSLLEVCFLIHVPEVCAKLAWVVNAVAFCNASFFLCRDLAPYSLGWSKLEVLFKDHGLRKEQKIALQERKLCKKTTVIVMRRQMQNTLPSP